MKDASGMALRVKKQGGRAPDVCLNKGADSMGDRLKG